MTADELRMRLADYESMNTYCRWESGMDLGGGYTADLNSERTADGTVQWLWVCIRKDIDGDDTECVWSGDYVRNDDGAWVMARELPEFYDSGLTDEMKHSFDYATENF